MEKITCDDIRTKSLSLGWDDVGITSASLPDSTIDLYRKAIDETRHAGMSFLENTQRCDIQAFLPGAKTIIMFVSAYKQKKLPFRNDALMIASFARGKDYHIIHQKRLRLFIKWLEEVSGKQNIAKGFSDTAPMMEKPLAAQAGLGTIGKNSLLIHPKFGSYILIAGVATTIDVEYHATCKIETQCGRCTNCIDICPTKAIIRPHCIDSKLCLAYHLIESRDSIPANIENKNPGYIFGCDLCQDVCPRNIAAPISTNNDFSPDAGLGEYLCPSTIEHLRHHREKLYGTPLKRSKILKF